IRIDRDTVRPGEGIKVQTGRSGRAVDTGKQTVARQCRHHTRRRDLTHTRVFGIPDIEISSPINSDSSRSLEPCRGTLPVRIARLAVAACYHTDYTSLVYIADDMIIILAEIDISQFIGIHDHNKPERCRRSGNVLYPVNAIHRKEAYLAAFRDVVHAVRRPVEQIHPALTVGR